LDAPHSKEFQGRGFALAARNCILRRGRRRKTRENGGEVESREQGKREENSAAKRSAQSAARQMAMAMELPFTLVGTVVAGGAIGYFLDRWLHTSPWFLLILGGLGFAAGVREVLRRLPSDGGNGNGTK
jgi:ATP synthase protein I